MKKILIINILVLLSASVVIAGPFLVSDPHGACGSTGQPECPISAQIFADGVMIADNVPLEPDMSFKYDIGGMPTGEIAYTAKFIDKYGRASVMSAPLQLLAAPGEPMNLQLQP